MLSGKTVVFHTGLALLDAESDQCQTALVDVTSTFRRLSFAEIDAYLRRDRPYDCAGSVKVEALCIVLFTKIVSDDPTALIGLPLIRLTDMWHRGRRGTDAIARRIASTLFATTVSMPGRPYLVPNLLGLVPPQAVPPARTTRLRAACAICRRKTQSARQFLKRSAPPPLQQLDGRDWRGFLPPCAGLLAPVRAGNDLGMLSDAGCPAVVIRALLVAAASRRHPSLPRWSGHRRPACADGLGNERSGLRVLRLLPAAGGAASTHSSAGVGAATATRNSSSKRRTAMPHCSTHVATCRDDTRLCVAVDDDGTESVESRSIRDWRGKRFGRYAEAAGDKSRAAARGRKIPLILSNAKNPLYRPARGR
jgi:hypothetical protein